MSPSTPLAESNASVDSYFGSNVFDRRTMKKYLSTFENDKFHAAIEKNKSIDFATADAIAHAMLRWATERGATHYTHWFQVREKRDTDEGESSASTITAEHVRLASVRLVRAVFSA